MWGAGVTSVFLTKAHYAHLHLGLDCVHGMANQRVGGTIEDASPEGHCALDHQAYSTINLAHRQLEIWT